MTKIQFFLSRKNTIGKGEIFYDGNRSKRNLDILKRMYIEDGYKLRDLKDNVEGFEVVL